MNKRPAAHLLFVLAILVGIGPAWCGCLDTATDSAPPETAIQPAHEHCDPPALHDAAKNEVSDNCEAACADCTGMASVSDATVAAKVDSPSADFYFATITPGSLVPGVAGVALHAPGGRLDPPPLTPTTLLALHTLLLS